MLIAFDCRIIRDKNLAGISRVVLEFLKKVLSFDSKNEYMLLFDSLEMKDFVMENLQHIKRKCRVVIVPFSNLSLSDIFYLPKILSERNVDIYYTPYYITSPFHKNYKVIITVFDLIHFFYPKLKMTPARRLFHRVKIFPKMVFRRADKIITISMATSRDLVKTFRIPPRKIKLIYLGVSKHFRPIDKRKTQRLMKDKFNVTKPYILFVGRNEPHKNIKGAILAYRNLPDHLIEKNQLVIVGKESAKYGESIRKVIDRYDLSRNVTMTGYVDESDLPYIYAGASVFLFPSFYEGFGLVILEAMSCGVPVVSSNSSSLQEVGGEAALYADPYDTKRMSQHIESFLDNQIIREEYMKKGFLQVKNFTWFNTVNSLLQCFNEVISSDGKSEQ